MSAINIPCQAMHRSPSDCRRATLRWPSDDTGHPRMSVRPCTGQPQMTLRWHRSPSDQSQATHRRLSGHPQMEIDIYLVCGSSECGLGATWESSEGDLCDLRLTCGWPEGHLCYTKDDEFWTRSKIVVCRFSLIWHWPVGHLTHLWSTCGWPDTHLRLTCIP